MSQFEMFDAYRRQHTYNENDRDYCDVDHLLRFWRENKGMYLSRLFGDKLILERPIEYTRDSEELSRDMSEMIDSYRNDATTLTDALKDQMGNPDFWSSHRDANAAACRYLCNGLYNIHGLIDNTVDMFVMWYDCEDSDSRRGYTIELKNGKKISMQNGMKFTRLWGQIAKALDLTDVWERFRIAHSQVLNQKKLKGTLCLSIHPLDYATASDNENGWSSCMSWQEEGCYRMGTVEMMNSPMVICAYLRSDKQHMEIDGQEWNSKKWRAWIIVTKDVIICNRHYPYHQPVFAEAACNWVRELVGREYGWLYEDVHRDFMQHMSDELGDSRAIEFHTNYMYNDIGGDDVIGMLRADKKHLPGVINFSGPAECMVCGEEIKPHTQDADVLECTYCHSERRCECCGNPIEGDNYYTDPNGDCICEDCYSEHCCQCTECDDTIWDDDATQVVFPINKDRAKKFLETAHPDVVQQFKDWRGNLHLPAFEGEDTCICPNCLRNATLANADYNYAGEWIFGKNSWDFKVPDPTEMTAEDAFNLIQPRNWDNANSSYMQMRRPEYAESMKNFWLDQWEAFKEDFVSQQS